MTRTTLGDLIQQLRGMTNAGVNLWTNGTATYFDDNELTIILDQNRRDFKDVLLQPHPDPSAGGSLVWYDYYLRHQYLEQTSGGTALFVVYDAVGSTVAGTAYTVDYTRGVVSFLTNTSGSAYRTSGRTYDVNGAAADVLERWAAHEALAFDFSADGQSFSRSQKRAALTAMAVDYRGKAWPVEITTVRSDLAPQEEPEHYRHGWRRGE